MRFSSRPIRNFHPRPSSSSLIGHRVELRKAGDLGRWSDRGALSPVTVELNAYAIFGVGKLGSGLRGALHAEHRLHATNEYTHTHTSRRKMEFLERCRRCAIYYSPCDGPNSRYFGLMSQQV